MFSIWDKFDLTKKEAKQENQIKDERDETLTEIKYSQCITTPIVPEKIIEPTYEEKYKDAVHEASVKFFLAVADNIDEWQRDLKTTGTSRLVLERSGEEIFSIEDAYNHFQQTQTFTCKCKDHIIYNKFVIRSMSSDKTEDKLEDNKFYQAYVKINDYLNKIETENHYRNKLDELNYILEKI